MKKMKKYKITENREELSEQEINAHKNFALITSKSKHMKSNQLLKTGIGLAAVSIVILGAIYFFSKKKNGSTENNASAYSGVPFSKYQINPAKDTLLVTSIGSLIEIPAGAFTDEKGNPVSGMVNLHFREFHHPAEIILSDVPMVYDSADTQYHFESAGMFEIQADLNSRPVNIAEGKQLQVRLVTLDTNKTKFNQYYMSDKNSPWQYTGRDAVSLLTKESLSADKRVPAKEEKLVKPVLMDKNKKQFRVETDLEAFPELALFREVLFEVSDKEKNYDARNADKEWEQIEIERTKVFGEYLISLHKGDETIQMLAKPVAKDLSKILEDYNKKKQADDTYFYGAGMQNDLSRKLIEEREIADKMFDKFQKSKAYADYLLNQVNITQDYVYRTFQVNRFGFYNSDCPNNLPTPGLIAAGFAYKDGNAMKVKKLFLVEHNRNAAFALYDTKMVFFNPKAANSLVVITDKNEVGLFSKEEFGKLDKSVKNFVFQPEIYPNKEDMVNELIPAL
jgi:hypothetical protein